MAEIAAIVAIFVAVVHKFSRLTVVHVEWGLFRLEFEPSKSKPQPKSIKQPKKTD